MVRIRSTVEKKYFEWMFDLVCEDIYAETISYRKLLAYLHSVEFTYSMPKDADRACDGVDLRYRFAYETDNDGIEDHIKGPCSVLEMMIAMAIRCEEVMDDPEYGNRTSQWFWRMIINLGLGDMVNARFDEYYVQDVVNKFLNREYESDGRGGLFRVRNCDYDLRHVSLWKQMWWMLDGYV